MEKAQLYEPTRTEPEALEKGIIKPVQLKALMTSEDLKSIEKNRIYWISAKINGQTMYATLGDFVPRELTTINRNRQNEPVGLPFVMGG